MTEGFHLAIKVSPKRGNIQANIHNTLSRTSPAWVASGNTAAGQHILKHSQSCFALVIPEDSGLVFQPICYLRRLLLFVGIGKRQWEGHFFWGCDPRSIVWIPCQILNTMPCLAKEEPFPTWPGLASHIPHALHLQHSLTRRGHAQRECCQDHWGLQLSQSISQRENSFHFNTGGRMHDGACLSNQGRPWSQAQSTCVLQGQVCIWSHIPKPSHSSQSLATVSCSFPSLPSLTTLESSFFFPVLPSFANSLTMKLTLCRSSSFPALHTFYSPLSWLQTPIFNMPANFWMSLSFLVRNTSSCELKWKNLCSIL